MDHRRRPQRDRPRRSPRPTRSDAFALPADRPDANLNTAVVRRRRRALVHRPVRRSTDGSTRRPARWTVFDDPRGPRPVRHHGDARRRHLVRVARRQPHRPGRPDDRVPPRSSSRRPPDQGARRVWSDSTRPDLGQRVECRPGRRPRSGDGRRGRSGRCPGDGPQAYAVYVDERDIVWLTDFGGERDRPVRSGDRGVRCRSSSRAPTPPCASCLGRPGELWGAESARRQARPRHRGLTGAPPSTRRLTTSVGICFPLSSSWRR